MKRYFFLLLGFILISCANQGSEHGITKNSYDGGHISAIEHKVKCYIYINGAITPSLIPLFDGAMKDIAHRDCAQRVVMINSPGGDIDVAMHIGREIREKGLSTDMHGSCESACIFIYVGGVNRLVHLNHTTSGDSKFGVHQPASELLFHQCVWDPNKFPQIIQSISQYLALMLPPDTAKYLKQAIFETSCTKIKYIDAQDMLSAGIATENLDSH